MERVKKGEKYWYIHLGDFNPCVMWDYEDGSIYADARCDNHNYFHTEEDAEASVSKIELILKGADVIEMPSEEEIKEKSDSLRLKWFNKDFIYSSCLDMAEWLKSKIVK